MITDEGKTYIGDGVYARFDGWQVEVYTWDGITKGESIFFDDNTASIMVEYFKKCFGGKKDE